MNIQDAFGNPEAYFKRANWEFTQQFNQETQKLLPRIAVWERLPSLMVPTSVTTICEANWDAIRKRVGLDNG